MDNNKLAEKLLQSLDAVLPVSQFGEEVKRNLKETVTRVLHDMDVVTRDEFEVQQRVLRKTREKIDRLEAKLKDYNVHNQE